MHDGADNRAVVVLVATFLRRMVRDRTLHTLADFLLRSSDESQHRLRTATHSILLLDSSWPWGPMLAKYLL
ncbi:hypothetical protein XALC_0963 [Xanthomonas albilineans GPE PC73]|uniref:Uncharacterized protein n=1 Tax=Xanthomonas albilineans (strain GPE PC73 / CFBP 7063) TaxID=380358 RepID=D2UD24_XANAP|nr:hypothetical protein XALC_0963 [Xanthomonas albilineans GPE PC73]